MDVVAPIQFGLLGSLEVSINGRPIDIGTPKERQLLAILLIDFNTTVSVDKLVDDLWSESPPAQPVAGLRTYVSNLRRALSAGDSDGKTLLVTESNGYALRISEEQLDSVQFEDLVSGARFDAAAKPSESVAATLDEALALVRGNPLADMAYEDFAQHEVVRLSEMVLSAEELRAELAIEMGDAASWLPRIIRLSSDHPLRERLTATHMTALAMTGRHAEALRVYSAHRNLLVEEMGIEPGQALRTLEANILAQDSTPVAAESGLPEDAATSSEQAAPDTAPSAIEAERRQLTVLCCGLAQSLSADLDPEDLRALVNEYQTAWAETIERFDGRPSALPDGGLIAYFGFPQAHEHDVERTIRAALQIAADPRWAARVGVATGTVVVGPGPEEIAGEAPKLAGQLRDAAEPGSVLINVHSYVLAGAAYLSTRVGDHSYRVDGILPGSRFHRSHGEGLTPLVGRDEELALLQRRWDLARGGDGQVVLLGGEAGVGKSRMIEALMDVVADISHSEIRLQCSGFHESMSLHPVIAHIESLARLAESDTASEKLAKLESFISSGSGSTREAKQLMSALLSVAGGPSVAELVPDPDERHSRLLGAVVDWIMAETDKAPLICIVEDAHWLDPTSSELLERLVDLTPSVPMMLIVTHRPQFAASFEGLANTTTLPLSPVSRDACVDIIRGLSGAKPLPPAVEEEIVEKSDGIPLFVEEVTKGVLAGDQLEEGDDAFLLSAQLPAITVPATLHDSLMARLDRLSSGKGIAQLGAAIGARFDFELLAAVAGVEKDLLANELATLVDAGIIMQRGEPPAASYRFKHTLIREIAQQSMLRENRRIHHGRIAEVLESERSEITVSDPSRLARHWQEAGNLEAATAYWQRAADRALETSALRESLDSVSRGLALVDQLAESQKRDSVEVGLLLTKALADTQMLGPRAPEVRDAYERVLSKNQHARTPEQHYRALWGRWNRGYATADIGPDVSEADELLEFATELQDPALILEAHHAQWATLLVVGEFAGARSHAEEGSSIYDADKHHWLTYAYGGHDPGVCTYWILSLTSWLGGSPEQAKIEAQAGVDLAGRLGHSYTLLTAVGAAALIALLDRDSEAVKAHSDSLMDLALKGKVPPWAIGMARGYEGAAMVESGQLEGGLSLMRDSSVSWRRLWGAHTFPLECAYYDAMSRSGASIEALEGIDDVLAPTEPSRTNWWNAELFRIRGEIAARVRPDDPECAIWFERAAQQARTQGAVLLELRALVSLGRFQKGRGDSTDVAAELEAVLSKLSPDLEITDVRDARKLIADRSN